MYALISFLILVVAIQIGIYLYGKKVKARIEADDVLLKYDIRSRSDLFQCLSRSDIPLEDMNRLQRLYSNETQ